MTNTLATPHYQVPTQNLTPPQYLDSCLASAPGPSISTRPLPSTWPSRYLTSPCPSTWPLHQYLAPPKHLALLVPGLAHPSTWPLPNTWPLPSTILSPPSITVP